MIKMWSLKIATQTPVPISNQEPSGPQKARSYSLAGPQFYASAIPIVPTAARLVVETKKIYEAPIDILPDEVQVRSVSVSAGHLSSASVYPACRTPYFLLVSCTDDTVRFLRCIRDPVLQPVEAYLWETWKMVSDGVDSALDISGKICTVASAHSDRFACAFLPEQTISRDVISFAKNVNISVYECESSGGVEWMQEERLRLEKCFSNRFVGCTFYLTVPV
jgi:hypothetical protein